jgi:hypothetical protein
VLLRFWRKVLKGREKELGIWPEESPGRGSGALPVNLGHVSAPCQMKYSSDYYLSLERASRTSSAAESFFESSSELATIFSYPNRY